MPEASQQTKQEPGPYPKGGAEAWEQFLFKFFGDEGSGDPGAQQLYQDQADYLQDALSQYEQSMQNIQPTQVSLGGQPITSVYPQGPQDMAGKLFKAKTSITPQMGQIESLNLLNQLANNIQTWRYGTPTQQTTGEIEQDTSGEIADWVNVASTGWDLISSIF